MTIEEVLSILYTDIVSYQKKESEYNYDEQTRRSNQKELMVLDAKISTSRRIIRLLQEMEDAV